MLCSSMKKQKAARPFAFSFFLPFLFFFFLFSFPAARAGAANGPGPLGLVRPLAPYGIFSTFSAFSLPEGATSVSYTIERSKDPSFYRHTLGFSYGISSRAELTADLPYVDSIDSTSGFEDFGAAFKYRFCDVGHYRPAAAMLVFGYLPTGEGGLSRSGGGGGGLALSRPLGPLMAHANFIYTVSGKASLHDEFDFLSGLEFAATHNLRVLGEFQLRKSAVTDNVDRSEVRFGYRLSSGDIYNTFGLGFDLKKRHPKFRIIFSIGASFGAIARRI